MELQTINQVSKDYGISARMLRYYEKIGLIQSLRKEDYAYRVYDETALRRLQQIVILRKLRVSMKQISVILSEPKAAEAIEIFKQNISELDDEINALSVIRSILVRLAAELQKQTNVRLEIDALMDSSVLSIVNSLSLSKNLIKENMDMDDLKKADEKLNTLTDRDVRIVYLPPSAVASAHYIGEGCESVVYGQIKMFINENNLCERKPDFRAFSFNNPMAEIGVPSEGYEAWVTIPDDMDVPAPLVKKQFSGGLYAAHMIPFGAFEEWGWLRQWVLSNERFVHAWGEVRVTPYDKGMDWAMEEPLNFFNIFQDLESNPAAQQLDLLFPIKPKFATSVKHPHERIVDTFKYNGMSVEVVEWDETIWCGKIGYAETTRTRRMWGAFLMHLRRRTFPQ